MGSISDEAFWFGVGALAGFFVGSFGVLLLVVSGGV